MQQTELETHIIQPPLPFPVGALPSNLYELAIELQRNSKASWELIVASLLSTMSLACQGSVNVQVPNGVSAPTPVSLFIATLVPSGGGKTTLDKIVGKPLGEFEVKQAEYLKEERIKFKADMIAWNIKKKAIEKAIEKASKIVGSVDQLTAELDCLVDEAEVPDDQVTEEQDDQNEKLMDEACEQTSNPTQVTVDNPLEEPADHCKEVADGEDAESTEAEAAQPIQDAADSLLEELDDHLGVEPAAQAMLRCVEQLKAQLTEHLAHEPPRPRNVKLIYNNSSPAAILRSLHENWSSASLSSDEAGGIFNGQALADLAAINKLWEGGTIHVERIDSESFILRNARLTLALMVQPKVFQKYLERRGDEARAIGLFARCLICFPNTTLGSRFIGHVPPVWEHLPKFHARITELLEQNLLEFEDPEFTRPTLGFTPEAKQLWIDAFNEIESYLFPGAYFADISDYGAKFGENLARVAALFHYFGGCKGDISYETLNSALAVCRWFMTEFKRLFSAPPEVPTEVADAGLIEIWLANLLRTNCCILSNGIPFVKKNDILQSGPNVVRNKMRLNAALNYLAWCNLVRVVKYKKTQFVELNLQYFTNLVNVQPMQGRASYQAMQHLMQPAGRY